MPKRLKILIYSICLLRMFYFGIAIGVSAESLQGGVDISDKLLPLPPLCSTQSDKNSFSDITNDQNQTTVSTHKLDAATLKQLWEQAINLIHQHQIQEARLVYKRLCEFDPNPDSVRIHFNLALTCEMLGSLDEAAREYKQALYFDPMFTKAAYHLASCYEKQRNIDLAVKEFEHALQLDPNEAKAIYHLALCYQQQGKLEEARQLFGKFITEQPNNPLAKKARTMFEALGVSDRDSADYVNRCNLGGIGLWPTGKNIQVFISSGTGVVGYQKQFRSILLKAFDEWIFASKNLTWSEVRNKDIANIICNWTSNVEKLEGSSDNADGLTFFQGTKQPNGKLVLRHVTVSIDTKTCSNGAPTKLEVAEIQACCLHEVGHALGLIHSPNSCDVMFFSSTLQPPTSLSNRDKNTIAALYELSAQNHSGVNDVTETVQQPAACVVFKKNSK